MYFFFTLYSVIRIYLISSKNYPWIWATPSSTALQEQANFLLHFLENYFGSMLKIPKPEIVVTCLCLPLLLVSITTYLSFTVFYFFSYFEASYFLASLIYFFMLVISSSLNSGWYLVTFVGASSYKTLIQRLGFFPYLQSSKGKLHAEIKWKVYLDNRILFWEGWFRIWVLLIVEFLNWVFLLNRICFDVNHFRFNLHFWVFFLCRVSFYHPFV